MSTTRRQSKEKIEESCFRHNLLTILTIASVAGGVILGFILKGSKSEWVLYGFNTDLKINIYLYYKSKRIPIGLSPIHRSQLR